MNERAEKLLKLSRYPMAAVFVIACLIKKPESASDYASYIGYGISTVSVLFLVYEKYFWRFIPWNRPYILKEKYDGKIEYIWDGSRHTKPITIHIKQTWLTVKITTETNINRSHTVIGDIIQENGVDVLYYTYITNPSVLSEDNNPAQRGTCRMVLDGNNVLKGEYWTSSKTVGNIEWK